MKTPVNGVNSTANEPGGSQRDRDDGEQRKAILAGTARREADRNEAGDSDEGAGEHREGRGGVGEGRSGDFVGAFLELGDHHLHGDHGVVIAAWFHSPIGIAAGLILVLAAWSYGLLPLRRA